MWTLGIDTSGRAGTIALLSDDTLVGERTLTATGRRHARTLVPEIADLLSQASIAPGELNVLAVSVGPGSFTGLRVGVVCAKTLAYALPGVQLVAVDSFLAVAEAAPVEIQQIAIFEDALRGELFAGLYERRLGTWEPIIPPRLVSLEDWLMTLPPEMPVGGPGVECLKSQLQAAGKTLAPETCWAPHARQVADIGRREARDGRTTDPWTLAPFYIRRSAAEEAKDGKDGARSGDLLHRTSG